MRVLMFAAVLFGILPVASAEDAADCPMKDQACTYVVLSPSGWLEVEETLIGLADGGDALKPYAQRSRLFLVTDFRPNSCTFLKTASTLYAAGLSFFVIQPGLDCDARSKPWIPKPSNEQCSDP
jgi:hypothetical protein